MAKQSIDPALLALQTAKKAMPASPSTQVVAKPSLNVPKQQLQAISTNITPPVTKIGGISSPFGAANINSSPVMGGATPQEIGTRAKELQSLPKAMPATGSEPVKKLSIDDFANKIKEKYPEYKDKDNKTLAEAMIKKYPEYKDKVAIDNGNFITDLGSGIGQSVAGFGNLGKKLAFGAVDLYRQSQGKEKLTPEQRASAEQTPMGQALNTITNRQTPEEKTSVGGQIGMVAGSVAQGAALGTPLTSALGKIPGVAQIATKAPVLSKIAGGVAQGLEGQLQYSAAAEGKLPTSKELFTAGAFGGAVNTIGPIAKGIKENIKLPKITTPTVASKADDRANQMLTNMNRITKGEQEKFAVQQGKTVGQFLNDKGIVSGGEKTIDRVAKGFIESKNKADEGLALIKGNYKNEYLSTMANEAAEFAENTLSPEAGKIRALAQKADDIGLTMSESNIIKRFYERNNKFTYGRDITAGEKTVRATNLDNYVRNRQMEIADQNGLSNLREINKDTQGFKYILDKLVKNEDGRLGNNAIGLTDWIVAGEVANNPSAIGLLVGKKIASSNRFRSGVVKILNRLSGHTNEADKVLDIGRIMQIQNEKDLNKFLALPLKKNVPTPSIPLNSNRGIQGMVKGTNVVIPPKPTLKTPPITVEKGAIGMGTPKVNKAPVIPTKATVAPSVSAPKVDTFARMTELDSNPLYKKKSFQETNYGRNAKGLETEFGTIQKVNVDNRYNPQSYTIDGVQYPTSQIKNFREKQAPEVVAQATKVSKAISDLKAIESGKGNIMGSSLRSVLDDLGIKDVNSIPEGTESDILQMVRARKPVAPKKGMPKLGKEIMEQNLYHGTNKQFDKFNYSSKDSTYGPGVYFTDSKDLASKYATKRTIEQGGKKSIMSRDVSKDSLFQGNDNLNYKKISDADYDKAVRGLADGSDATAFNKAKAEYAKQLMDEGYDGLQIPSREAKGANEYVVFDNRNIKKPLPPLPKKGLPKLGKETLEQNVGKIPEGSTVTNTKGKPLIVYHGTSKGGFDKFKSGYFTEDKGIAKIYESSSASSIGKPSSFYNTPDTPAIYEVQLDIKKPFDTRDKKIRDLFYKEYQGKYSLSNADLSKRGLPDWTEGEYIRDRIEETGQPFDGIIVDEGGLGGYGEKILDRGISYAPIDYEKQVKILNKNINNKKSLPPLPKKGK